MKAFMAAQGASGTTGNLGVRPDSSSLIHFHSSLRLGIFAPLRCLRTVSSLGNQAKSNQIKPNQTGKCLAATPAHVAADVPSAVEPRPLARRVRTLTPHRSHTCQFSHRLEYIASDPTPVNPTQSDLIRPNPTKISNLFLFSRKNFPGTEPIGDGQPTTAKPVKPNQTGENHPTCFNSAFRTPRSEFRLFRPVRGYSGYFYEEKGERFRLSPTKSNQIQVNPGKSRYFYGGEEDPSIECPTAELRQRPLNDPRSGQSSSFSPREKARMRGKRAQCLNAASYSTDQFNPSTL